jgi:CubicO group peptidase (beta-lactamase class C family)
MPNLLPETRRALRHRLATGQVDGRAPSVVAAVVRDGGPVWLEGWGDVDGGPPDGDVQYRIGSITKTFVTLLVLRLRDEGRLTLGDPLTEHLPGTAADRATVGSLLAHTSGLVSEPPGAWWEPPPARCGPSWPTCSAPNPRPIRPTGGSTTPIPASPCSARWSNGCAASRGATCCGARSSSRWV